jgi:DmsE family decaheme c-type cytochrome
MGWLNRCVRATAVVAAIAMGLALPRAVQADEVGGEGVVVLASIPEGYSDLEADDCMDCHDQDSKYPVLSILATPHGVKGDSRTPLGSPLECQTCHGKSLAHTEDDSDSPPLPEVLFGLDAPAGPQTEACLACHQSGLRMGWAGSQHDLVNIPCAGCHKVHAIQDPVLIKNIDPMVFNRTGQASVCFQCHQEKRAQVQNRVSAHPLREGKILCSDCHNPHGSMGPRNLAKPTLNETCYQCHAEKRGPFLWEHAPVRENCGVCHDPHGSNNLTLLKGRMPYLCQQCHMAGFHPSDPYGGPVPGTPLTIERRVGSKSCLNCHSQVHGSNHPSGARWAR